MKPYDFIRLSLLNYPFFRSGGAVLFHALFIPGNDVVWHKGELKSIEPLNPNPAPKWRTVELMELAEREAWMNETTKAQYLSLLTEDVKRHNDFLVALFANPDPFINDLDGLWDWSANVTDVNAAHIPDNITPEWFAMLDKFFDLLSDNFCEAWPKGSEIIRTARRRLDELRKVLA